MGKSTYLVLYVLVMWQSYVSNFCDVITYC